ncbi:MAG: hypothetical protein ACRYFL_15780 [Janthinobacterium lividum]
MKTTAINPSAATLNQSCFWQLDLYTGQLEWSAEISALLGLQKPYAPTLEQLIRYYQPEKNIRSDFQRAVHQGIPFELDLSSILPSGKVILICTIASPVYDDYGKCIAVKGVLAENFDEKLTSKSATTISENTDELHIMLENFAKVISHNLRSHTSNLQMVLESINPKTSPKEMRHVLGDIKLISSNLNETVGYLNTLTRI